MFHVALPVLPLVAAALLSAIPAIAETPAVCDPLTMDCSPMVACVEATGEIFRGATFGRERGPFRAESAARVVCEGMWVRGLMGLGLAEFTCSDGRSGTSTFTWFEPESGTAVGSGKFSNGEEARFWAGNNLERYFQDVAPEERQRMSCTPEDMLLS